MCKEDILDPTLTLGDHATLKSKSPDNELDGALSRVSAAIPRNRLIHELFEDQAARSPTAIAVTYRGHALTYGERDLRTNQLANYLRHKGISSERLVGIATERGVDMVIAIIATLKSGGAYV